MIEALGKGHKTAVKDIELTFFTKERDLVSKLNEEKRNFEELKADCFMELRVKDVIIKKLEDKLQFVEREMSLSSRILRDPMLNLLVASYWDKGGCKDKHLLL